MVAYTKSDLSLFTTSTLSNEIMVPPEVPHGMLETASVWTVT